MSDNSKPGTSRNHKPLVEARAIDMESDDDTSLSVRQSKEPVNNLRPVVYKAKLKIPEKKMKMLSRTQKQPLEDSEEEEEEINVISPYQCVNYIDSLRSKVELEMVRKDREERRRYRNDVSLAISMNRALLLEKELMERHENSDEEEIDVVNLPPETTNRRLKSYRLLNPNFRRKLKRRLQQIGNDQHNNLASYRTRKPPRHLQNEDEEIDVVGVTPDDIPSSSVSISSFSTEASLTYHNSYLLRKRLHTCNLHYTRVASPPPMVTIDLLDATINESTDLEQSSTMEDNIDVIDITDTSINNDIVIVEDTADESTPDKQSTMPRRVGLGDCPVCLEEFSNKEIMSTICGHVFCAPCIKGVIRANKKCPNCRKHLTLKSIHPLFI